MPTLSLTDVVAGNDILAADLNNGWATLESVVNALDTANWASGKIFAANKITQGGATVGQSLVWDGTDFSARTPIYVVEYNPTTVTTKATTTTTGEDVDANLSLAVNLTTSGKMIVVQSCSAYATGPTEPNNLFWGIRESTTDVAYRKLQAGGFTASASGGIRITAFYLVTGLSSGAHTYKWAAKVVSGTGNTMFGTQSSPATGDPGPATMAIIPVA